MFQKRSGWVLDQQFMDQMGSPFLLAHGLGKPVEDAVAEVRFTETGKCRVWARTRDWVAPWKTPPTPEALRAEGTPGIFQVKIDGEALATTFGDEGDYDMNELLDILRDIKYSGPIGIQCNGLRGDARLHLERSMGAWKRLSKKK